MKRLFALAAVCLLSFPLASASTTITSPLVHDAWVRGLDKAQSAVATGDYTRALALLTGGVYTKGVTVGLDERGLGPNREKARRALGKAVAYWDSALGDDCPIRFSQPGDLPDMRVALVDSIGNGGDELGLIEMKKSYQWSATKFGCTTTGKISVIRSFEGQELDGDEMAEVMAHELGHLLGLADVEESGGLMGPMDRSRLTAGPTQAEVAAVLEVRRAYRTELASVTQLALRRRG
jgi:hypothetical protein